jgi:hypothetical protein
MPATRVVKLYAEEPGSQAVSGWRVLVVASATRVEVAGVAFVSAYILPSIAETDPGYVDDVLAAATNGSARGDIGLMQSALNLSGVTFLTGGLVFGIALYRRASWPAGRPHSSPSPASSPSRWPSCPTPSTGSWPSPTPSR